MATNGIRAMTPVRKTLDTAVSPYGVIHTVPDNVEQTILLARATNRSGVDGTITIGLRAPNGVSGSEVFVAFNTPVKAGLPQNVFGPDILGPLPAGTQIVGRGSSANAFDVVMTGTERTI